MMASIAFNSAMSFASLSGGTSLPTSGPLPPGFEVVKNTGSIRSKSRSSRMRCMRTEPTMPRQPIKPTRIMFPLLQGRDHGIAHGAAANLVHAIRPDIGGTITLGQRLLYGIFHATCIGFVVEGVSQHHGGRQDGRQRIGDILVGDVRRRTVA